MGARSLSYLRRFYHHVFGKVIYIQKFDNDLHRMEMIKNLIEQSNKKAKEAYLGPFESENKFKEWALKFINYLFTIIGVNGVPCLMW